MMFVRNVVVAAVVIVGVVGALVLAVGVGQLGIVGFNNPLAEFSEVDVEVSVPAEARIVAVEAIHLDCRARVHAEVPVEAKREHRLFGKVYRTDRVTLDAVGDVDTCVDGGATRVERGTDGRVRVVIPGESIRFVRPRIDTAASVEGLGVDQGFVGEVGDVVPGVSDDLGLTPLVYAYAQNVIGSSQCMRTAYAVTRELLVDAYRQQLIDQGVSAARLSVVIEGDPVFVDPLPLEVGDVQLSIGGDGSVVCTASGDVGGVSPASR